MSSIPASNSSGVSTTAAAGGGVPALTWARQSHTRCPTRGHRSSSSHLRSSSEANALAATAERSTSPFGATSGPHRETTAARTSSEAYRSRTTSSVESVAAPRRSSAASAVDFPAASPPVRPTKGTARAMARASARLLVVREDVLGEAERRHVVEVAGLAGALRRADRVLFLRVLGLAALGGGLGRLGALDCVAHLALGGLAHLALDGLAFLALDGLAL